MRDVEKARARARAYYWAHREKALAANREWFQRLKARPELHLRRLAKKRAYYRANRDRCVAYAREYHRRYPQMRLYQYLAMTDRFRVDAEAYAEYRARERARRKREAENSGRVYRPKMGKRLPDWALYGESVIDIRSQWLIENLTPAQRDYAMRLAIERKEWSK